jgi:thiol-disulfide isomerase/thioredoxin
VSSGTGWPITGAGYAAIAGWGQARREPGKERLKTPPMDSALGPSGAMSGAMRNAHLAQLAFTVVAAVGVYSFLSSAKDGERRRLCTPACALRPHYANDNRVAPDFELPTLDGSTKKLSDYRGKVVVLNFWTKTCKPCLEEMPSLADFAQVMKADPELVLLTVSTDETVQDARDTLHSILGMEAPFTTFVDAENTVVADLFGTKLYPETWFIDKEGIIRARFDGGRDWMKPLHLEFAQSLKGPVTCSIDFVKQKPEGPLAGLCSEVPLAM